MDDDAAPPVKDKSILFDVWMLSNATERAIQTALAGGPLNPGEYALYSLLADDGPMTPSAIASAVSIAPTSASFLVGRLVDRRHGRRIPDARDRRSHVVELTDEGRRVHAETRQRFDLLVGRLADTLGEDAVRVRAGLRRLRGALDDVTAGRQTTG